MKPKILLFFLTFFCSLSLSAQVFVDPGATGANNGTSWTNAYTDLQTAINSSTAGSQIWIKKGTYFPTRDASGSASPTDPRTKTFYFDKNLEVYGGFNGTEVLLTDRPPFDTTSATILNGDLGIAGDYTDNAYNVCTGFHLPNSFLMDGLVIERGASELTNRSGAAFLNDGTGTGNASHPNFSNVYIKLNISGYGGAVYNKASNGGSTFPTFSDCIFRDNIGEEGGAMQNDGQNGGDASPTLTRCQFIDNGSGVGGAVYNKGDGGASKPVFTNCRFLRNDAILDGGAVFNNGALGDASATFQYCRFDSNRADGYGGAMANSAPLGNGNCTFFGCDFTGNQAALDGGALWNDNASTPIDSCDFIGNQAGQKGGAIFNNGSQGKDASPLIQYCYFYGNQAVSDGGAIYNDGTFGKAATEIHWSKFIQNKGYNGGAIFNRGDGDVNIGEASIFVYNSIFSRNVADYDGAAIYITANGGRNCWVATVNVSFYGNWCPHWGTCIYLEESNNGYCAGNIYNTASWGNASPAFLNGATTGGILAHNSIYEIHASGVTPVANCQINADPLFVNPTVDDLTLQNGSPAIDAGDNSIPNYPFDLAGEIRVQNSTVDIGAYEFNPCPRKLFVDVDATGANDGSSWTDAFNSLQDALDLARVCSPDTIWVAEGTYKPEQNSSGTTTGPNDPTNTFFVDFDVVILGGFQGIETHHSQRDWVMYETILDGNIGALGTSNDNCNSVVDFSGVTNACELDGFTVRAGRSGSSWGTGPTRAGGGIFIWDASPLIRNCWVKENWAYNGGGIYVKAVGAGPFNPAIISTKFENNFGFVGGGIEVTSSNVFATLQVTFQNCEFLQNQGWNGGGIAFNQPLGGSVGSTISNSTFWNNNANIGAAINNSGVPFSAINCSFGGNVGGVSKIESQGNNSTGPFFQNCILWDNWPEINKFGSMPLNFDHCVILGGWPGSTNTLTTDPLYMNSATGDLRLQSGSPAINSGINGVMPVDAYDVDRDGDFAEAVDIDLATGPRVLNTTIDRGALESGMPTGTEQIAVNGVRVYPTVAGAETLVRVEMPAAGAVEIQVISGKGDLVATQITENGRATLSTKGWAPGLYLVRAGSETRKVLKMK